MGEGVRVMSQALTVPLTTACVSNRRGPTLTPTLSHTGEGEERAFHTKASKQRLSRSVASL